MRERQRVLFIGGSLNQTTQMHQIAREMPEVSAAFAPFYVDGWLDVLQRGGAAECTVAGAKLRERCLGYLEAHGLDVDPRGESGPYDLVVTCSDLVVQRNVRDRRLVLVQEGILDAERIAYRLCRALPFLPRWLAGTSMTGQSRAYDRFCVASAGYRDHFVRAGLPANRIVVTGIPNFDDCRRYLDNDFPHRGYVLVCTSDARETWKRDDRPAFLRRCLELAAGRPLIFKLHPNEDTERARREIAEAAPGALVFDRGSAEHMIANCEVLVTQYSSTVFVGLALGKECHSYLDLAELRRLLPVQNASAAANIAQVCREELAAPAPSAALRTSAVPRVPMPVPFWARPE